MSQLDRIESKLDRLLTLLFGFKQEEEKHMAALDDAITALGAQVQNLKTVEDSATALITGIPKLVSDAVAKALAAGATPAQLQALNDLSTALTANAAPLAAAIAANTPNGPPVTKAFKAK